MKIPAGARALTRCACVMIALMAACADGSRTTGEPTTSTTTVSAPALRDVTEHAGIDFTHANGMVGRHAIVETMGAGGALFDADNDGDLDLYLVQGGVLPATSRSAASPPLAEARADRLFRNDSARRTDQAVPRFVDVTANSGQLGTGYGIGAATGDVDGDGDVDLYITNDGDNQLLLNRGDGSFEDATAAARAQDNRLSVPAVFFDLDRDGWLDLYVGNYVDVPDPPPRCRDTTGSIDYCGPDSFAATPDRLLRNLGAGPEGWRGFEDITARAGLSSVAAPALGAIAADFDGDGWLDLYVANDGRANHLWMNQGRRGGTGGLTGRGASAAQPAAGNAGAVPRFVDQAVLAGCAVNASGSAEASMGVEAVDIDQDGDIDLFMTHLISETNTLYLNDGQGMFEDASTRTGLGAASRPFTAFGTGVFDLGNDGLLDLVVLNGAVNKIPALVRQGDPYPLHQPNLLFVGTRAGGFENATATMGPDLARSDVSRGAIFGDVDNDGDTDLVVTNNHGPARLLLDVIGQDRAWLGLRVVVGSPPRDALGARAAIERAGGALAWQRIATDGSYGSARDPRLRFGLGDDRARRAVRVRWLDGTVERFPDLAPGRYHTLTHGAGSLVPEDDRNE